MPAIACPINGCEYVTEDVDAAVAAALLTVHNNVHVTAPQQAAVKQKAPKILRPNITKGSTEENWNSFIARWGMFKRGTALAATEICQQLFSCCDEELGNDLIRQNNDILNSTEQVLMETIKKLAVTPVAVSVRRSDLLALRQADGENVRSFHARIKGKAATCAYSITCSSSTCTQVVDFTDIIIKDVLISGLSDEEIKIEVFGWHDLDRKTVNETVQFIEAKEMARNALARTPMTAAISNYKRSTKSLKPPSNYNDASAKRPCKECSVPIEKSVWSRRQKRMIERNFCSVCWARQVRKKPPSNEVNSVEENIGNSAIAIGSVVNTSLTHLIFDTERGWKKAKSLKHPTLSLTVDVDENDYITLGRKPPSIESSTIAAVTDTGAMSCLWGLNGFLRAGFTKADLIPVKQSLDAANKEVIPISGAIFLRLSGFSSTGERHTAAVMTYISPSSDKFYLSEDALLQLNVISPAFPEVGGALHQSAIQGSQLNHCDCKKRVKSPSRPDKLPFECVPSNNDKMRRWLINYFSASTFNQCTHQELPGMTGPEVALHVDDTAVPYAANTPAPVPLHWQNAVKEQLDNDVAMGVLEKVPIGEPSKWCHRMVITPKSDGSPRRTVDLSPLNCFCLRETHHVQPPFKQAKKVPSNSWKSVTDAWNGFHSVPIRAEHRHYTTFITPWGRYRYRVAPQGFLASGDAYSRRFDEIISDVERKTKCVDDTLMWDDNLTEHWWRVIDFLILLGNNGVILNQDKFQFAQRTVDFAGFQITEKSIKPSHKFISAISEFPTPSKLTDVRSWFGLVNQVAHYDKLSNIMEPFKHLLSPKTKFEWTSELETAFQKSKAHVVESILKGVEIFDPHRYTCLRPDWSKTGIGFFLSQKHCNCLNLSPDCCKDGWRITLAGSRFLRSAETRYAPVEGEALAIAWSLEQTRYFTQGCDRLIVVTDHKPLLKLFGDRTLDEITNPRLFRLKQRTLLWRFSIIHAPGKSNFFSDATSRHPVQDSDRLENGMALDSIRLYSKDEDSMETELLKISTNSLRDFRAVTWEVVQDVTRNDCDSQALIHNIETKFPSTQAEMPSNISSFWRLREDLHIVDGVIMMGNRVVIPKSIRAEILQSLHAAHQGVTAMKDRARCSIYWPGITKDIELTRDSCFHCNRCAPSQAKLPPFEPHVPSTPFEAIACDYFLYKGHYYFIAADRLSGWTEQSQIKSGTSESGFKGLRSALRKLFMTFGVPVEVSSDGGPEFKASETTAFFQKWGVRHRISSSYLPSSNGRAELAVKATKRLLMDNIDSQGHLNTDKMVRALLIKRNTPDPSCNLSSSEVLFGHKLRDTLPYIRKDIELFNNDQISHHWRENWQLKEEALKTRYVKTLEKLTEHSRQLPPLDVNDRVLIQNQSGLHPLRWDRSGVIVDVGNHDQYYVKVAGTGRVTRRNRRFLRKYQPHLLHGPDVSYPVLSQKADFSSPIPTVNQSLTGARRSNCFAADVQPPSTRADDGQPPSTTTDVQLPSCTTDVKTATTAPADTLASTHTITDPPATLPSDASPPQLRRSTRIRMAKKIYEPETGLYV